MVASALDGGDLEVTLRKHRARREWLRQAELFLASENDVCQFHRGGWDFDWSFTIDVPRAFWEPILRKQIEEAKVQVAEMDAIAREYFEAALK